jgi:hypothetical protein
MQGFVTMRTLLLILLLCIFPAAPAQAQPEDGIEIRIEKAGRVRVVDANIFIPATPLQTWAVLTDWDNLAGFMTAFRAISIVSRSDSAVRMKQTVRATFWPFSFDIELEQELELFPYEKMQSRLLGGDFDQLEGTIHVVADRAGTRIVGHTEFVPRFWIPPVIGPMIIERKMRQQFQDVINEIARRNTAGTAAGEGGGAPVSR